MHLFIIKIKDNIKHLSCATYQATCSRGNNYVGETMRNLITRIHEHEQSNAKSEPKHLKRNPEHKFDWIILSRVSWSHIKSILEAYVYS